MFTISLSLPTQFFCTLTCYAFRSLIKKNDHKQSNGTDKLLKETENRNQHQKIHKMI